MAPSLIHSSLHAVLDGTEAKLDPTAYAVEHYRGIKYGKISQRFAKAALVDDWHGEKLDCSRFGPQCPQNNVDAGHLLRIPEILDKGQEEVKQDEFECLNLNVSVPARTTSTKDLLPVLMWIHGGSQIMSFPPAAHRCSDTTTLVQRSIEMGKPMIIVTFNYRLNIFGFGDGGEKNLALKDQQLAIEWVVKHIAGFGGDKDNITLAGESAGAVYAHAHLTRGAPVARGILQSGSLYLSPPQPLEKGTSLISSLSASLLERHNVSLSEAPVPILLQSLLENNINPFWIQQEPDLLGWEGRVNDVQELLIGDVEYESVIWRNGIETVSASEIAAIFDNEELKNLYGVSPSRPTASRLAALDFINDLRFALPIEEISASRRSAGKATYQYVFDQVNPWQSSSRAHHGVDLISLFGGYDLTFNPAAAAVAKAMQERWIAFVNGESPWNGEKRFAFGPHGKSGEITDEDFAARRRVGHFDLLRQMDSMKLGGIFGGLAAGRISLLN
ncbi:hypothetical protein VE04_05340 [Pseudogymnoascus sp. 24MN13]|nr:hypothetical protein VE04_05340 [Pseudogymnoascus sp. 24MN13]